MSALAGSSHSPSHSPPHNLEDSFGRRFSYLRLSITDACNFRCKYCLPNGYKATGKEEPLSLGEMINLVQAFAGMGTVKLRLTGGEPTLRRDFLDIVGTLARVPGIEQVAVSTNAWNLKHIAKQLQQAGVSRINVSLDSLDPKNFAELTGTGHLDHVLAGIDECLSLGYEAVKINAVLMATTNAKELHRFLDYVRVRPVSVRFIELMRTSENARLFSEEHISADFLRRALDESGWQIQKRGRVDGPAIEYSHADYHGRIGIIAPYAKDFCSTCNRLRVGSRGGLRLCLFGEGEHSLRPMLQDPNDIGRLQNYVQALLGKKEISHFLSEGRVGVNSSFSAIGG